MGRKKSEKSKSLKNIKPKSVIENLVLGIIALIVTFIIVSVVSVFLFLGKINNNNMIAASKVSFGQPVNIMLLGTDIGDPSQPNNSSIKRTDTIMVLNYNPDNKKFQLVSIPRDTLIDGNGRNLKINSAYAIGGEKRVKLEVEKLLSVNINYIIKIDYNAFREFIDAIGGVKMEIERNMIYDDEGQNLHINFKAGEVAHLDGKKAEEFFRWRKNNDGSGLANGDIDRIENQQKFISKVMDKCTSPTILFRLPSIVKAFGDNIETNMSAFKTISYGFKFMGLNKEKIIMKTAQGNPKTINGESFLIFDKNLNKDIITSLSSSGESISNLSKDDVTIEILNATKINGLAAGLKQQLAGLGYSRIDTGNIEERDNSSILSNNEVIIKMIDKDIKINKHQEKADKDEFKDYDVVIILGKDFKNFGE